MQGFLAVIENIQKQLQERPMTVRVFGEEVEVIYAFDETDGFYARVPFHLPEGILGEIGNDTFGELSGFRFYFGDL